MSSTVNGSILNRQDRLWVPFLETHQFFPHIVLPLRRIPVSTPVLTTQSHHVPQLSQSHTSLGGLHWAPSQNQTAQWSDRVIYLNSPISQTSHDCGLIYGVIPLQSQIRLFIICKASSLQAKILPPCRSCLQVLLWARTQTNENPSEKVNVEILPRQ